MTQKQHIRHSSLGMPFVAGRKRTVYAIEFTNLKNELVKAGHGSHIGGIGFNLYNKSAAENELRRMHQEPGYFRNPKIIKVKV